MSKIAIIGAGYVGLATGVALASLGHKVMCMNKDEPKMEKLKSGVIPIYEPGLDSLLNAYKSNIKFTSEHSKAVQKNEVIFICIGTLGMTCSKYSTLSIIKCMLKKVVVHAITDLLTVVVWIWSVITAVITAFENEGITSILAILNYGSCFVDGCIANRRTVIPPDLFLFDLWRENAFSWVQRGCLAQVNASSLDRTRGDDLAQDLIDRGLIACTAMDAHDATKQVPSSIWNEWGMRLLKEGSPL